MQKPTGRKRNVLFVNGERLFKRGRNQNTLEPEHVRQILDAYLRFADHEGLARVADLDEIAAKNHNLNISLYVSPPDTGETTLHAQISDRMPTGVVYTTFHHPISGTNVLTTENSDWATNCPEYKVTAVQVALTHPTAAMLGESEADRVLAWGLVD
jgi:type I restriction-modification system DNA methylase subunit